MLFNAPGTNAAAVTLLIAIAAGVCFRHAGTVDNHNYPAKNFIVPDSSFKVFIYPVPDALLRPWQGECKNDMYRMEILFPEILQRSRYMFPLSTSSVPGTLPVSDAAQNDTGPERASYYFIPQHSTCLYHHCVFTENRITEDCKEVASVYVGTILNHIKNDWPYWNRTGGTDHLLVFPWDQASEILGFESPVKRELRSAIHLTTLGAVGPHANFDSHKDIVIPPFANMTKALSLLPSEKISQTTAGEFTSHSPFPRTSFAYFRGTIIDDFAYSQGVRQYIRELGNISPERYHVHLWHSDQYWEELISARFALCPSGWSPWSPRLFDSIVVGTLPVIFADDARFPFEEFIDYRAFSLKLLNSEIDRMDDVLKKMDDIAVARKRWMGLRVRDHFLWNLPSIENDAFDLVMQILYRRRPFRPVGNQAFHT